MSDAKPYWWPLLASEEERANTGWKYSDTWDHLGDAREHFEALADAFLALVEKAPK